jgi:hypothetical protein
METLNNIWQTFLHNGPNWLQICLVILPSMITAFTNYPRVDGFLKGFLRFVNIFSVLAHKDSPSTLKAPIVNSDPPEDKKVVVFTKPSPATPIVLFLLGGLLFSSHAKAQYLSVGASLPMMEFQPNNVHPVQFAPGLGVEASLGFYQRAFFGAQWDLLDLSATLFGNAPGALQAALSVGTFNDLIFIGAAVPLYTADSTQPGAFQGGFHVYPILGGSIPIEIGPYTPPSGAPKGAQDLVRGGTAYYSR